jgi:hypothetical protein
VKIAAISEEVVLEGRSQNLDWFHAKAAVIPPGIMDGQGAEPTVLMTVHIVSGNDVFSPLFELRTTDLGKTWTEPVMRLRALGRRQVGERLWEGLIDFCPKWHTPTGTVLGIGHTARYLNKADDISLKREYLDHGEYRRFTGYASWSPRTDAWVPWQILEPLPEARMYYFSLAGCSQNLHLPDGTILVASRWKGAAGEKTRAGTVRCEYDGKNLRAVEAGNELVNDAGRGFAEPSLCRFAGAYHMTLRAEDFRMWHASSADGLHWEGLRPWTWDDGTEIETDQTQQHWLARHDELYLIYTRKTGQNDHMMRYRAPLLIAQVDPERMCLIRDTERVVLREQGARLGNFMVEHVTPWESWVTVGEWVQNEYVGDLLLGRIRWSAPNELTYATGEA